MLKALVVVALLGGAGALAGVGVGYALWGTHIADLHEQVEKVQSWIAQEMRGADERNRSAETRIKQLEAEVGKLKSVLAEAQADLRAEHQRRRALEERLATSELRRGR